MEGKFPISRLKYCFLVAWALGIILFGAGCQRKDEVKPTEEVETAGEERKQKENQSDQLSEQETTVRYIPKKEELSGYSNEIVTWGPGIQMGEDKRPVSCVAFQIKYEALGAEFLREKEKVIYLTFDQGYENGYTDKILDVLEEKSVDATFFVTMDYAEKEKDLMQRMVDDGHVIGDHSVSHPIGGMPSLTIEKQLEEYTTLHNFVKDNYGYEMYLTRPPAGIFSEQSLAVASHFGYRTIMWSFAYADWDPEKQMAEDLALSKLQERLHPGAIYLLHAVSKTNAAVLDDFIDYAIEQGYEFKKFE